MLVASLLSPVSSLVRHFGALAFIAIGLLDQSIVPIPGSMDALLIWLTASHRQLWWYYVLMATAGAVLGGYVTYRISKKGGKEALEKKIGERRAKKAYDVFDRWGFWSIFFGAIAPPPVPVVPFLMTAGVMQYPKRWFLLAYGSGRIVRFSLVAWITLKYGKHIFRFFSQYYRPAMYTLIALAVVGGIVGLWFYLRLRRHKREEDAAAVPEHRAA